MIAMKVPQAELADVCRRYHVRELAVFGSIARGEAGADSDIDVLVEFEPGARIGFLQIAGLAEELEPMLGRRVDLAMKTGLKPEIRAFILRDAEVLFPACGGGLTK